MQFLPQSRSVWLSLSVSSLALKLRVASVEFLFPVVPLAAYYKGCQIVPKQGVHKSGIRALTLASAPYAAATGAGSAKIHDRAHAGDLLFAKLTLRIFSKIPRIL